VELVNLPQAVVTEGVDDAWQSFGVVIDFRDDLVSEEGIGSAGDGQVMLDIRFGFILLQARHLRPQDQSLTEGFEGFEVEEFSELRLRQQDQEHRRMGVDSEVGKQAEFFESRGLEQVRIIDDQHGGFVIVVEVLFDGVFDGGQELPFEELDVEAELRRDTGPSRKAGRMPMVGSSM